VLTAHRGRRRGTTSVGAMLLRSDCAGIGQSGGQSCGLELAE